MLSCIGLCGYSESVQGKPIWRSIQSSLESRQGQTGTVVTSVSDMENSVLLCRWKSLFFQVKCELYAFSQITLFFFLRLSENFMKRTRTSSFPESELYCFRCGYSWSKCYWLDLIIQHWLYLNSFLALNLNITSGRVSVWQVLRVCGFQELTEWILLKLLLSVQELVCSLDVDLV